MALLGVLGALAVVALLLLAVTADVHRTQRAVRRDVAVHVAFGAAEQALYEALGRWPDRAPLALAPGGAVAWARPAALTPAGVARTAVAVTRLGPAVFRVDADAMVGERGRGAIAARRATSLLVTLEPARLAARAAVVVLGAAEGDVATVMDGRDTLLVSEDAECAADSGAVPGLLAGPAAELALDLAQVAGEPPRAQDAALEPSALVPEPPGDTLPRASVVLTHDGALAQPVLRPVLDPAGACAPTAADGGNWGDPQRATACADYRPVVHVRGDLVAPEGAGQGLLLVDGALALHGGFTWHGIVLVRGRVHVVAAGDRILGTLLLPRAARTATGVPLEPHRLHGLQVRWSRCAVRAALRAAGAARPVGGQAWRPGW